MPRFSAAALPPFSCTMSVHARVAEFARDFAERVVLRTVVDDDDLERLVAVRQHRANRPRDHLLLVERGDDDADRRPERRRRTSASRSRHFAISARIVTKTTRNVPRMMAEMKAMLRKSSKR